LRTVAGLIIGLYPLGLCKSAEYPTSFIPFKRTIYLELVLEDPFATDNIRLRRPWNQIPCVVHRQSVILLLHGGTPIGVSKAPTVLAGNWREQRGGVDGREVKATLCASGHPVMVGHRLYRDSTMGKRSWRNQPVDRTSRADVDEAP